MHEPTSAAPVARDAESAAWPRPAFEVISLDCEITSYAPDDGDEPPLF